MIHALKRNVQNRFASWLDRRIPPSRLVTLDQRRIFIFPSQVGRWFLVLLLVMLVAAINYQKNLAFALVFFLASLFVVAVLHTFANLSGLVVKALRAKPVFAGESAEFEISLGREDNRRYFDIQIEWPQHKAVQTVSLLEQSQQRISLYFPAQGRGWLQPPRLLIQTFYPLGLLRCWTWLALDLKALVYPKPLACAITDSAEHSDDESGELVPLSGSDDFYQFSEYRPGDPLKHVYWKSYAKQQPLQTKQFASYREQSLWLDWHNFSGDTEQRLSKLCYWVLQLENSSCEYGLRLPGVEIAPAHGESHQSKALRTLALYKIGDDS